MHSEHGHLQVGELNGEPILGRIGHNGQNVSTWGEGLARPTAAEQSTRAL